MELSPRLGLGTIRTNLYQNTCLEFRYRDGKVLGAQPPRPFTYCVPNPNLIKGFSNRLSKLTHTLKHAFKHTTCHIVPKP